ncbi:DNA recombination protein RmuC [Luminiphilus sp.]|nr:DNA recombination protein RmuC [Luminiphilus sp.]MDA9711341.1 DNA recombination protein RmuC [Luminiphilus sp.]
MTGTALFWLGITAACAAGLGFTLVQLRKQRIERDALHQEVAAQRTAATLATERAEAVEAERRQLLDDCSTLRAQLSAQTATLAERGTHHESQMKWVEESRAALRAELEVIGQKLLASSGKALETTNQKSLDSILRPLAEKIDSFQSRVNQVHSDMVRNSASLSEQIKHLESVGVSMSGEAQNLTRALKGDKKLIGNWGEAQLEKTLELAGLRRGEHYDAQVSIKDERGEKHLPDFVIRLPEGKNLVIDSKVSLIDYERAVTAETDAQRSAALEAHGKAVKQHIDSLSAKDYANLPGMQSPDFVLMFMPVEPAYIEVMREQRELFNHGYQKNVVLVSHTTLMPILRTVANLWMIEHSNREVREISERAGDIYNTVCLLGDRLLSLGASLSTATSKYNYTVKAVQGKQGLAGKVARFQALSKRANKTFPETLSPIDLEIEVMRIDELHDGKQTPLPDDSDG